MEVKEEEESCYILSIPNELQRMIFERMEPADKISFGQSSRKCRTIWKNSKSLYDGIGWDSSSNLTVMLSLNNSYPFVGNKQFIAWDSLHQICKVGQNNDITQYEDIEIGKNGFKIPEKKFVEKLEKYQNTVKSITIKGPCSINLRNIQSFPNLQYLRLSGYYDHDIFPELLLKSGNKLKYLSLCVSGKEDYSQFYQIYRVREYLSIDFALTREQLLNLSARKIKMAMGNSKAEDIFEFIRTWQNGTSSLESCTWIYCYRFDAQKLFGFFNVEMNNNDYKRISIRGIGSTSAMITFRRPECLTFKIIENPNLDINLDEEELNSNDSDFTSDDDF